MTKLVQGHEIIVGSASVQGLDGFGVVGCSVAGRDDTLYFWSAIPDLQTPKALQSLADWLNECQPL